MKNLNSNLVCDPRQASDPINVYELRQGSALIINKTLIDGVITKDVQDCVFLLIRCKDEHIGLCHIDRGNSLSSIEDFLKESSSHGIKK